MSSSGTEEGARHGVARSPLWEKIEKDFLKKNPKCLACDSTTGLQVHHCFPYHYAIALGRPDLELDERNLVVLCETESGKLEDNHHLLWGHLGDFKEGNLNVKDDAAAHYGEKMSMIRESAGWQEEVKDKRIKPLDQMTGAEKDAFRTLMDTTFPLPVVEEKKE